MLVPVILYKKEIEESFSKELYTDNFYYYLDVLMVMVYLTSEWRIVYISTLLLIKIRSL